MFKVALINMPFSGLDSPSIGLGILKRILLNYNIHADVFDLNLEFAATIGQPLYERICKSPSSDFVGEFIFRNTYEMQSFELRRAFYQAVILRGSIHHRETRAELPIFHIKEIENVISMAKSFIDEIVHSVNWREYSLFGFTTTFQQNFPSFSLANKLKSLFPCIPNIFGGANCEGEMGLAMLKYFPFIDAVCTGRGEESFAQFATELNDNGRIVSIGNIHTRSGTTHKPLPKQNSTWISPDYSDYFSKIDQYKFHFPEANPIKIPFESSQGCWWGEKHHCTFCGLNGRHMSYQTKPTKLLIAEIASLMESYGSHSTLLFCVDNIIHPSYFRGLLQTLSRNNFNFFFETKANLKKEEIKVLSDCGVRHFQPGIESLNSEFLTLIDKGTNKLINVQTLVLCRELGVEPVWNVLRGIPGELPRMHRDQIDLVQTIHHLTPPTLSCSIKVRFDRFSPYQTYPDKYGITDLEPFPSQMFVYDFLTKDKINELCYFFTGIYEQHDCEAVYLDLDEALAQWKIKHSESHLTWVHTSNSILIYDSRLATEKYIELTGLYFDLFFFILNNGITSEYQLFGHFKYDPAMISSLLENLQRYSLIIREGHQLLLLPTRFSTSYLGQKSSLREVFLNFKTDTTLDYNITL